MENFDLKKFLVENKLTTNSRLLENTSEIAANVAARLEQILPNMEVDVEFSSPEHGENVDHISSDDIVTTVSDTTLTRLSQIEDDKQFAVSAVKAYIKELPLPGASDVASFGAPFGNVRIGESTLNTNSKVVKENAVTLLTDDEWEYDFANFEDSSEGVKVSYPNSDTEEMEYQYTVPGTVDSLIAKLVSTGAVEDDGDGSFYATDEQAIIDALESM